MSSRWIQRSRGNADRDDARLTEGGNARSEQVLVMSTESLTNRVPNQKRMAARRSFEWIGTSKAWLVLNMKYPTCYGSGS